jgi:hypothetical protein
MVDAHPRRFRTTVGGLVLLVAVGVSGCHEQKIIDGNCAPGYHFVPRESPKLKCAPDPSTTTTLVSAPAPSP